MKALLFVSYTAGSLYAANRWEIVATLFLWLYLTGAFFLIFYSAYRWLTRHRWL